MLEYQFQQSLNSSIYKVFCKAQGICTFKKRLDAFSFSQTNHSLKD